MPLRFFLRTQSQVQPQPLTTKSIAALDASTVAAANKFLHVPVFKGHEAASRENSDATLGSQNGLDLSMADSDSTLNAFDGTADWNLGKPVISSANFANLHSAKSSKLSPPAFRGFKYVDIDGFQSTARLLPGLSSKTFTELSPIEEVSRPSSPIFGTISATPSVVEISPCDQLSSVLASCDSKVTVTDALSIHSPSIDSLAGSVSSLSIANVNQVGVDKSKKNRGILARFMKKDSTKEKSLSKDSISSDGTVIIEAPPQPPKKAVLKPQVEKKEKLTVEQKEAKALAERERRLEEVLSVLEGRKKLPQGMEDLKFANFIGDGTYGFVVTAFRNSIEVAVKFIFKEKIPSNSWVQDSDLGSVPSEIHFLKNLNHPNVIGLVGCYEDDKYMIMVTELHGTSWDSANPKLQGRYIEGLRSTPRAQRVGSEGKGDLNTLASLSAAQRQMLRPRVSCDLFECIDAHEYFPERVVRHIFAQIVNAVAYLHSKGVVHRDLKDENIVIDEHYNVKLIDFGSAAFIPSSTSPLFDKFLGTMDFAAPEIVDGYRYRGPEVEIWALGVLLYILVFRQVPFKTSQDVSKGVLHLPVELKDFYSGTTELYDLLSWMLQRNKDHRPSIDQVLSHGWVRSASSQPL